MGRVTTPLDEDEARTVAATTRAARGQDRRGLLHQLLREPGERGPHARDPRGGAAGRVRLDVERDAARDLRVRALLDDRRQRGALTAGRRLRQATRAAAEGRRLRGRPAAAALRRRRHDRGAGAAATPCGSPPRASPRARSPAAPRGAVRATRTPSGSTWAARAPTSRSSTTARCAPRTSGRVEYGHPICFPSIEILTIGAGGGSLAWIDPAGSLRNGPQSAGADPGAGVLQARRRGADEHGRQRGAGPPGRRARRRRDDARPSTRRRRGRPDGVGEPLGLDVHRRPRARSCASRTRTWPTRCG